SPSCPTARAQRAPDTQGRRRASRYDEPWPLGPSLDQPGAHVTSSAFVHDTADVSPDASIGAGSKVWHYAQVREGAQLGENVIVGRGAYVGTGVELGDNCKVQNYALVYEPAKLANGVFIGPAVVLTNDHFPRAINADGSLKSASDWEPVGVTIGEGASIGASATCVAPVTIGRWSLVGSGSVVVKD